MEKQRISEIVLVRGGSYYDQTNHLTGEERDRIHRLGAKLKDEFFTASSTKIITLAAMRSVEVGVILGSYLPDTPNLYTLPIHMEREDKHGVVKAVEAISYEHVCFYLTSQERPILYSDRLWQGSIFVAHDYYLPDFARGFLRSKYINVYPPIPRSVSFGYAVGINLAEGSFRVLSEPN